MNTFVIHIFHLNGISIYINSFHLSPCPVHIFDIVYQNVARIWFYLPNLNTELDKHEFIVMEEKENKSQPFRSGRTFWNESVRPSVETSNTKIILKSVYQSKSFTLSWFYMQLYIIKTKPLYPSFLVFGLISRLCVWSGVLFGVRCEGEEYKSYQMLDPPLSL